MGVVRPLISWLTRVDDLLLRFMSQYPSLALPPKVWYHHLNKEVEISYTQVKRRLKKLSQTDLVNQNDDLGNGYQITDIGMKYVENQLSKETLEEMNPDK